jgi:hypothetical protein
MDTTVVTYQYAYIAGETSLCDRCIDDVDIRAEFPSIGPVSHGAHRGHCDGCRLRRLDAVPIASIEEMRLRRGL